MSVHGLIAYFDDAEALADAARTMRDKGYARLDAFSPYPVDGLAETLGMRRTRLPLIVLAGGILGVLGTYALILYSVEIDYPINVGGRPLNSWPAYTVIAFEAGILGAALAGFVGLLAANRLPEYYHPVFNAPGFTYAHGGRFCLLVEASDPKFRKGVTKRHLTSLGATLVEETEP
jgi:hypothetical protein